MSSLMWAALAVFATLLGRFLSNLYFWRRLCRNKPGPPHHPIWGHLLVMGKVVQSQPKKAAAQNLMTALQRQYNLPDCFYIDTWPFAYPVVVATHPDIANQFTVKQSLPKHPVVADFMESIGGRDNLVSNDGQSWKTWRSAFNPGFSASHLMTLMPCIVEHVQTFCDILEERAKKGSLFRLERLATHLTIDIIGRVVLDIRFNSQTSENELVSAFESQVRWLPSGHLIDILETLNPFRRLIIRYNSYTMDRLVSRELEKRFASREERGRTKHVVDLALETYLKEKNTEGTDSPKELDKTFKRQALDNIKVFLFAGHDTSSSAICYALYHLGRNRDSLIAARKEIKDIFGPDASKIGQKIKDDPWLLNKMEYGSAVIREVLRLYPPASTARSGTKDFFIIGPETNQRLPTEHFLLWASNTGPHRNHRIWGADADIFRPERWFDPAHKAAYYDATVSFSKGPRNCIGQELALLELKMVLAMTVTRFEFTAAYDELDKLRGDGSGYPSDSTGIQEQFGEQAYQIQIGTAKPREGMPGRVKLVV